MLMCTFGQVGVTFRIRFSQSAHGVFTSSLLPGHQCFRHPPTKSIKFILKYMYVFLIKATCGEL